MGMPTFTVSSFPGSQQTSGMPQLEGTAESTLPVDGGVQILPVEISVPAMRTACKCCPPNCAIEACQQCCEAETIPTVLR